MPAQNSIGKATESKRLEASPKGQSPRSLSSLDERVKLHKRGHTASDVSTASSSTSYNAIELLRSNVIGQRSRISSPFRKEQEIVYADYTASGRCLQFVEDYMTKVVAPTYANTRYEIQNRRYNGISLNLYIIYHY